MERGQVTRSGGGVTQGKNENRFINSCSLTCFHKAVLRWGGRGPKVSRAIVFYLVYLMAVTPLRITSNIDARLRRRDLGYLARRHLCFN